MSLQGDPRMLLRGRASECAAFDALLEAARAGESGTLVLRGEAGIEQLVAEEHRLWEQESAGSAGEADKQRLGQLKVSLEECWDLLGQRRALQEAGRDPDAADLRRPQVVEGYEQ